MPKRIALGSLVIILVLVNLFIVGKERHLTEGKNVFLELAPVDPRSLMQGDYMALHFQLADDVYAALPKTGTSRRWRQEVMAADGWVIVNLDDRDIGSFRSLYADQTLSEDEMILRYRVRSGEVKFATNAYFFQEGHGQVYEPARYGQFRVDNRGELLLVDLYDKDLLRLGPAARE
jgi:uncharacterized membrane-anchored protein